MPGIPKNHSSIFFSDLKVQKTGENCGQVTSSVVMPAANFLLLEASPHLLRTARPGTGREGRNLRKPFPDPWPWPWPGARKGSDQHCSQREGTKTLPPLARPSSLLVYGLRKALSLLPSNPPQPSPISRALPRQAGLSPLAIDRICVCIDVAAMLQVSFCRPCFLGFVASLWACVVSLRGGGG